jgi:hypothetical protein
MTGYPQIIPDGIVGVMATRQRFAELEVEGVHFPPALDTVNDADQITKFYAVDDLPENFRESIDTLRAGITLVGPGDVVVWDMHMPIDGTHRVRDPILPPGP